MEKHFTSNPIGKAISGIEGVKKATDMADGTITNNSLAAKILLALRTAGRRGYELCFSHLSTKWVGGVGGGI